MPLTELTEVPPVLHGWSVLLAAGQLHAVLQPGPNGGSAVAWWQAHQPLQVTESWRAAANKHQQVLMFAAPVGSIGRQPREDLLRDALDKAAAHRQAGRQRVAAGGYLIAVGRGCSGESAAAGRARLVAQFPAPLARRFAALQCPGIDRIRWAVGSFGRTCTPTTSPAASPISRSRPRGRPRTTPAAHRPRRSTTRSTPSTASPSVRCRATAAARTSWTSRPSGPARTASPRTAARTARARARTAPTARVRSARATAVRAARAAAAVRVAAGRPARRAAAGQPATPTAVWPTGGRQQHYTGMTHIPAALPPGPRRGV